MNVHQTNHGLRREVLRSRLVHELDFRAPLPSGAGLADPDATEVLPRIELETGDLPTQPRQIPVVPGQVFPG